MNAKSYIQSFVDTLGFESLEAAKANLENEALHAEAHSFYESNNGNDGEVTWSDMLNELNCPA